MEENTLSRILTELQEQNASLKKQVRMTRLCTLILVAMILALAAVFALVGPRLSSILDKSDRIAEELDIVATELDQADIPGMLENVNTLVFDSQATMEEALKKIQTMDIDTLNEAINSLNQVVTPLANLFGR